MQWYSTGCHTGNPVPRQCHTGKPVPWHQAGNPVLEACPQVVPCWGHVTNKLGITLGALSPSWTGDTVPKSLSLGGSGMAVTVSPSSSGATQSRCYQWW